MAEDPSEVVAKMRAGLYRNLYKRKHGMNDYDDIPIEDGVVMAPSEREIKPYVPPTDITENEALPYGNVVGAPLGF
jgi:hypothetical protein